MSQVVLPYDWDNFTVKERFGYRGRPATAAQPLVQKLLGWVNAINLVGFPGPAANYEEQILRDSPIGYWRLDGTVLINPQLDVSGEPTGPRNLTNFNDPDLSQPGLLFSDVPNLSIGVDGPPSKLCFGALDAFWPDNEQAMSIECWFSSVNVTDFMTIMEVRQSGNTFFQSNSGTLSLSGTTGFVSCERITSNTNTDPDVYNDGNPHHAVLTCRARSTGEGGVVHLYVDGVDYGVQGPIGLTGSGRSDHRVNVAIKWSSALFNRFFGFLDEAAVYNYELSQAQVTKHFNAGDSGTYT